MPFPYSVLIGKSVKKLASLRGGGSALPGLVVERIDSGFIARCLSTLPRGVVVISGTNGKTTTTKMVVELFESQGLKVFTNRTGSNFTRGVAAALLGEVDMRGNLDADIAALELDEAHAAHFVKTVKPTYSLLLNVMRDQLDRFGEIDKTADLLAVTAEATSQKVVINREDPRLLRVAAVLSENQRVFFGLSTALEKEFPSDDDMRAKVSKSFKKPHADVTLESLAGHTATIAIGGKSEKVTLKLDGIYNIYNAAAAIALVATVIGTELDKKALFERLSLVTPAFGRGEILTVNGQPCELVLVKNPSGFRLGLKSFDAAGYATMIAINDNYADGRDMSWLWDVDFETLEPEGVAVVGGVRAYDMALRLQYEGVEVTRVSTDLAGALDHFLKDNESTPKRIYCTYTAMLDIRRQLAKVTEVEKVS